MPDNACVRYYFIYNISIASESVRYFWKSNMATLGLFLIVWRWNALRVARCPVFNRTVPYFGSLSVIKIIQDNAYVKSLIFCAIDWHCQCQVYLRERPGNPKCLINRVRRLWYQAKTKTMIYAANRHLLQTAFIRNSHVLLSFFLLILDIQYTCNLVIALVRDVSTICSL